MRTVVHLERLPFMLILQDDGDVVTAVSTLDVLRGDKPYRKYPKVVKKTVPFDTWNDMLEYRLKQQPSVLEKALNTKRVSHSTRHPLGIVVGDYIKGFEWNAIVTDYIESPVTDFYGLWVMAAKNITRQQHEGELWRTGFENMEMSTQDAFLAEYHELLAEQQANIEEALRLSDTLDGSYLAGLAQDYLDAIDGEYSHHVASERSVLHEQILQALGKTRDDDFDAVGWAREMVAGG